MLKKIKNLKCPEIFLLTSFANFDMDRILKGEELKEDEMKYADIMMDCSIDENKDNEMFVGGIIDDLMFELYSIYLELKDKSPEISIDDLDFLEEEDVQKFKEAEKNVKDFTTLYERLMLETKFEYANIRSVQKIFLNKRLQREIDIENYEFCSLLKARLEEV